MNRVKNFSAGPSPLPLAALERAQAELLDFNGTGMSVMEQSHRAAAYSALHAEVLSLLVELLQIPDTHQPLLLGGGASLHFAMVPLNFLKAGSSADYLITGAWSERALDEANRVGQARVAAREELAGALTIPTQDQLSLDPSACYVHLTTNNTIRGTQWHELPDTGRVPLIADMSSDILSRPIDVSRFALFYAGAQKNLGPSGLTVVVIDKRLAAQGRTEIPKILSYQTHVGSNSLYNTPPTFSVYMLRNVLAHLKESGGVAHVAALNERKSAAIYSVIDRFPEVYRSPVPLAARSQMNVVFRLPSADAEKQFLAQATERQFVGLKGHRSVGGIRVSLYNAVSEAWAQDLAEFMVSFAKR